MSAQQAPSASTACFRCPSCGRLLRVPVDGTAKTRRCPVCDTRVTLGLVTADHQPRPARDRERLLSPPPPQHDEPPSRPRRPPKTRRPSFLSMRARVRCLWLLIQFGLGFFMFALTETSPLVGLIGLLWMIFGLRPARWLARHVAALTSSTIGCPHCGFEFDAVGRWTVGGYNDHRERHILLVRSPIDGKVIGHTDCPQCQATIFVQ